MRIFCFDKGKNGRFSFCENCANLHEITAKFHANLNQILFALG